MKLSYIKEQNKCIYFVSGLMFGSGVYSLGLGNWGGIIGIVFGLFVFWLADTKVKINE